MSGYRFGIDEQDEAEDRGHRKIHCSRCGYCGWSEDTGGCPRCAPETDCVCGHDLEQHRKGIVQADYCRHCPCETYRPIGAGE